MPDNTPPAVIGRRIVIHGATGSGKTTLSKRLASILGVPAIEMDAIRHNRGWDDVDWPEMAAILEQRLEAATGGWVCEGNYSTVSHVYVPRADTYVWLRIPLRVSFLRLLRRTVTRAITREPLYHAEGPRESWRLTFFSPRSILWWSISNHRSHVKKTTQRLAERSEKASVFILRSPAEVEAFVADVERRAALTPAGS